MHLGRVMPLLNKLEVCIIGDTCTTTELNNYVNSQLSISWDTLSDHNHKTRVKHSDMTLLLDKVSVVVIRLHCMCKHC